MTREPHDVAHQQPLCIQRLSHNAVMILVHGYPLPLKVRLHAIPQNLILPKKKYLLRPHPGKSALARKMARGTPVEAIAAIRLAGDARLSNHNGCCQPNSPECAALYANTPNLNAAVRRRHSGAAFGRDARRG